MPRSLAIHISISSTYSVLSRTIVNQPPLGIYSRAGLTLEFPLRSVLPALGCFKHIVTKASGNLLGTAAEHAVTYPVMCVA